MISKRSETSLRRSVATRPISHLSKKLRRARPIPADTSGGVGGVRGGVSGGSNLFTTVPKFNLSQSGGRRSRSFRGYNIQEHGPYCPSPVQIDEEMPTSSQEPITAQPLPEQPQQMDNISSNNLQELIPGVNWFTKPHVVRSISSCFQQHYNYPYLNWTEVPEDVRALWFRTFKGMFTWKPELETQVRHEFNHVCQRRVKDHVNKAARRPVPWMSKEIRRRLLERRQQPAFVSRSNRNKENKVKGSEKVGGTIAAGHHQGSISAAELAQRLASENEGVMPTAADLFMRTHSRKVGLQRVLVTEKAKKTMAKYEQLKAYYESKGVEKDPNEVFYEAVGGHKKGQVYGLGKGASLYYERARTKTIRPSTLVTSAVPIPGLNEVQQLKTEMEHMRNENAALQAAIKRLEEQQTEKDTRDKEMWRFYQSMSQNRNQFIDIRDSCSDDDPSVSASCSY